MISISHDKSIEKDMNTQAFTKNDYYDASLKRLEDVRYLQKREDSIIFALYCAGVAVECMFRAYILQESSEFNSKHDLINLFTESKLLSKCTLEEKKLLTSTVKRIYSIWFNNLRYTTDKRMKRIIINRHTGKRNFKNINKWIKSEFEHIFSDTEYIIKLGVTKWN